MKIRAALVTAPNAAFELADLSLDDPGPGEVLIKIVATGVCHTDTAAQRGLMGFPLPGVLGHEGAGHVQAVGPDVDHIAVGDAVIMGWPHCGSCAHCLGGQPRYCLRLGEALVGGHRLLGPWAGTTALATPDGTPVHSHFFGQSSFATHALAHHTSLVTAPAGLPVETLGPLACGLSTGAGAVLNELKPWPGSSLVVYGAGAVGLAAIMAARSTAATNVVAVDIHPDRLDLATALGATDTVNSRTVDPVQAVTEICNGPADFAVECTGVMAVCRQAIDSIGMLGTCALVGGAPAGSEFVIDHATTLWGKRIKGVLGGGGTSNQLITALAELHRQGRFPFERLLQFFPLDDIASAVEASLHGTVIKPVLYTH